MQGQIEQLRHPPQVAGQFYPADTAALRDLLTRCVAAARPAPAVDAKLIVAPHAGLVFSGPVAATAFASVADKRAVVRNVVVLGPAHRMAFQGIALHPAAAWATPLGDIPVARALAEHLGRHPHVRIDPAPFVGEHSIEMLLPFIQTQFPQATILPILVGDAQPADVAQILADVWGGPETLIAVSSDLSHFLADDAAKTLDRETRAAIERLDGGKITSRHACGHRALAGALLRAQALDMRLTGVDLRTSGDTRGGRDRVVGYGAFVGEYAASAQLSEPDRSLLLTLAARALRHAAENGGTMPKFEFTGRLPATLTAVRATFVTLEQGGRLRGCIGSLVPHRPLALDVATNAVKAGFGDPRFPPLSTREIDGLDLSVSILSHPRPMAVRSEDDLAASLAPDVDGLMFADAGRSALFLPSVWRTIPDARTFVRALKRKAGVSPEHWSTTATWRRFGAEYFGGPLARAALAA